MFESVLNRHPIATSLLTVLSIGWATSTILLLVCDYAYLEECEPALENEQIHLVSTALTISLIIWLQYHIRLTRTPFGMMRNPWNYNLTRSEQVDLWKKLMVPNPTWRENLWRMFRYDPPLWIVVELVLMVLWIYSHSHHEMMFLVEASMVVVIGSSLLTIEPKMGYREMGGLG